MITNEQLDERADELTSLFEMAGYGTFTTDPLRIYRNLTREALGRDKETMRWLYMYRDVVVFRKEDAHELDTYIIALRKRLGLEK